MHRALSNIIYIFISVITISLLITCGKEYSYEKDLSKGTAGYSINCTNSRVTGNFFANTFLDSTNKLQIQVEVTSLGTYKLSTNNLNGFSFSDTGSFAVIGLQTITLKGKGKPNAVGNFTFNIIINSQTCSFVINVQTTPVNNAVFSLAGAPNNCDTPTVYGDYVIGMPISSYNRVFLKVNVTSIGAYRFQTDTVNGIYFSTAGTFTNTGIQTVTLSGYGTPILPRNSMFTPQINGPRCSFVVPNVQPGPYAEYVLESAALPNYPCIYTVNGSYIVNTLLTSSNTVSIQVFVVRLGSYAVATQTVNGMQFSASGTFTNTGGQTLVLSGTGTPTMPGTFLFKPEIVGASPLGGAFCTFQIGVQ